MTLPYKFGSDGSDKHPNKHIKKKYNIKENIGHLEFFMTWSWEGSRQKITPTQHKIMAHTLVRPNKMGWNQFWISLFSDFRFHEASMSKFGPWNKLFFKSYLLGNLGITDEKFLETDGQKRRIVNSPSEIISTSCVNIRVCGEILMIHMGI